MGDTINLAQNKQLTDRRIDVDVMLTQLSLRISSDQNLIGDGILKPFTVDGSSALIQKHGSEGFALIEDALGDWAEPKRIDFTLDKMRVNIEGHALSSLVSIRHMQEARTSQAQYDLLAETTALIRQNMLLARESGQATLLQNSAVYTVAGSVVVVGAGDRINTTTADPLAFFSTHIEETIPNLIGLRPNTMWMGQQVWTKFMNNVKIRAAVFGTTAPQQLPTQADLARLFNVERILVGTAVSKNSAGTSTRLWGKNLGLAYVPPTAGRQIPAFGYTVQQSVFNGSHEAVQREFDTKAGPAGAWYVKRGAYYTASITFPEAGMLFQTVVD